MNNLKNDLMRRLIVDVQKLKVAVENLEEKSHEPRDFVTCDKCKCKIREK